MRPLPRASLLAATPSKPSPLPALTVDAVLVASEVNRNDPAVYGDDIIEFATELHPALVRWLIDAGWEGDCHELRLRPTPRSLDDRAVVPLRCAAGDDFAQTLLRGSAQHTAGGLQTRAGVLRVTKQRPDPCRVADALGRLDGHTGLVVADEVWFALVRQFATTCVLAPAPNPADAVVHDGGRHTTMNATAALAELERVHLQRPVSAHPEVIDVATMAASAPTGRVGLLGGQDAAVAALAATTYGAVLAAPPGAGKTVIAAVALGETAGAEGRNLVAVPSAVVTQWSDELTRWAPQVRVAVARDLGDLRRKLRPGTTVVTTYDVAGRWGLSARTHLDLLVVDEANVLQRASQRARGLWAARQLTRRAWALTGTPDERHGDTAVADLVAWVRQRERHSVPTAGTDAYGPIVVGHREASPVPTTNLVLAPITPNVDDLAYLAALETFADTAPERGLSAARARQTARLALGDPATAPQFGGVHAPAKRAALVGRVAQHCATGRAALVCTASAAVAALVADGLEAIGVRAAVLANDSRLRRVAVLSAFATGAIGAVIVTPASQRGVNLQTADFVAHLDLPATTALFDQRNARAVRIGNPAPAVTVWVPYLDRTWDAAWVAHATSGAGGDLDPLALR